jgi:hypothetical protein
MIEIIGLFLIVVSILVDDVMTLVMFTRGFGALESNPIYVHFGLVPYICIITIIYILLIVGWLFILRTYNKIYAQRGIGFKIADITVFIYCIFIVFFAVVKISTGFDNMQLMGKYMDSDTHDEVVQMIEQNNKIIKENPGYYKAETTKYYYKTMLSGFDYLDLWLFVIFGYLLFRVGYKVLPYENG